MRVPGSALVLTALLGGIGVFGCKPTPPPGIKFVPPVRTAVSLSPDAAELMTIGYPRLVGRSASDNFPASLSGIPIVADVKPDYEKIAALKPDVIIFDPSLYSTDDIAKLKALKIPLAMIEGDTVDEFIQSLFKVGQITQSETGFMDYIDRISKEEAVCRTDPIKPAPKTAILTTSPNSNPMIAGTKSFYADLIRIAGGDPVGPPSNKFEPINAEALLALNPDAVVVPTKKGEQDGLTTDSRFSSLKAIKNGKVMVMDEDYILRRGERVDIALKTLHDAFIKLFK